MHCRLRQETARRVAPPPPRDAATLWALAAIAGGTLAACLGVATW